MRFTLSVNSHLVKIGKSYPIYGDVNRFDPAEHISHRFCRASSDLHKRVSQFAHFVFNIYLIVDLSDEPLQIIRKPRYGAVRIFQVLLTQGCKAKLSHPNLTPLPMRPGI